MRRSKQAAFRAVAAWLLALAPAADGQSALERGAEALRRQDLTTAESALRQAVREQPGSARAQKLLGMVYSSQKKFGLAEQPLRQACTLDPREEYACYYLGRLEYTLDRYSDARSAFDTALRYGAGDRGRLLDGLALTLEAMGDTAAAEADYKAASEAGYRQALIDYGMFLFHHGRGRESLPFLKKANANDELERVTAPSRTPQRRIPSTPRRGRSSSPPGRCRWW